MASEIKFLYAGDTGLVMEYGREIDPAVNARVKRVCDALKADRIDGVTEILPTYRSLLVTYRPERISFEALRERLISLDAAPSKDEKTTAKVVWIPVSYGGAFGEDMPFVSAHTGLSERQIVELHSEPEYLVYMLGFLPGFPYLGGMDKRLTAPRLKNPRTKIPEGSVGIGGEQTGIYPLASPGGWQLIGRTPVRPYDPGRSKPFLYGVGDFIKFFPIDGAEYRRIEESVSRGDYICRETLKALKSRGGSE